MSTHKRDVTYAAERRHIAENEIKNERSSFLTVYYAVYNVQELIAKVPEVIVPETVSTLGELLLSQRYAAQRQGLFLFRQAADALSMIVSLDGYFELADQAMSTLTNVLNRMTGHSHRAAAEALSALPYTLDPQKIIFKKLRTNQIPVIDLNRLQHKLPFTPVLKPYGKGRSLVFPSSCEKRLAVIKLARKNEQPEDLHNESCWMTHLSSEADFFLAKCSVPHPITVENSYVFRLANSAMPKDIADLHPKRYAIGFVADGDYYRYPNETAPEKILSKNQFIHVIANNAWLLGYLTSQGVVHTALIPLFHNRTQRHRRRDLGYYEWFRAGRLDKWITSCDYPNIGLTGLRDFEHFERFSGSNRLLYRHIGTHFLSLLLITGTYFRNKQRKQMGIDENGAPVDATRLFDKVMLRNVIETIFLNYYDGFVGTPYTGVLPLDVDHLCGRMIAEMGVDTYMEELLRVTDQDDMTEDDFNRFLYDRGYPANKIPSLVKGAKDIIIHSGPHLGHFNDRISIPELIEAVSAMSAMCAAGKFWREKNVPCSDWIQLAG